MKLYIKQKVFSWNDKFFIKDEAGQDCYCVEGELLSWGKKLHVYDMSGQEVAFISQELMSWLSCYHVDFPGRDRVTIRRKFTWLRPHYELEGIDWTVDGSVWLHDYDILQNGQIVASLSKELMTWGDSYELDVSNPADALTALAVALVIDCVIDSNS